MLSVSELLKSEYFKTDTFLIAGNTGLTERITWSSSADYERKGYREGEFVFSDGFGLNSEKKVTEFVRTLISSNCAGVCIETALNDVPLSKTLIELCDDNFFPLIQAKKVLPIQDIITFINLQVMEDESEYARESERFYHKLLEFSSGDIHDYISYTAEYLGISVAYWHILSEPVTSDESMTDIRSVLNEEKLNELDKLSERDSLCENNVAISKIEALGERYAYILFESDETITRYQLYILSRLTSFLRTRVVSAFINRIQKKHVVATDWLKYWFDGRMSDYSVREKLKQLGIGDDAKGYYVCLVNVPGMDKNAGSVYELDYRMLNDISLQISIAMFRHFQKNGFKTIESFEDGLLKYVVVVPKEMKSHRKALLSTLKEIHSSCEVFEKHPDLRIAVGRKADYVGDIASSHRTALFASSMSCLHDEKIVLYTSLGYLTMIEKMKREYLLDEFVHDTLYELLDEENRELLDTLKVYIECGYSKQLTAEKLFIVRQTLYSRLDKIAEILGDDFDQGERGLSVELAVRALEFR